MGYVLNSVVIVVKSNNQLTEGTITSSFQKELSIFVAYIKFNLGCNP